MQHFKVLRAISLLLVLALLTFGCATSKRQVKNPEFKISAEAVPEGILISFSNLPSDVAHLWLGITAWEGTVDPSGENDFYHFASLTAPSVRGWVNSTENLDRVKQTGRIIFPVVQRGYKYNVSALVYNESEFRGMTDLDFRPRSVYTEFTVENNGISFNKDNVKLEVNDTYTSVTLSSEPIFSTDMIFDDQKYSYGVGLSLGEGRSISIGDHHFPAGLSPDGLNWVFEPYFRDALRNGGAPEGWLVNDTYPARANVYANIIYDEIKWSVELTRSPEFKYHL